MMITLRFSELDTPDSIYPITSPDELDDPTAWFAGFLKDGPVILHSVVVED